MPSPRPSPPPWEALAQQRWAGADPEPGIVIPHDHPGPSLETRARALDPANDPYALSEREAIRAEESLGV
jgi:hypothetical protein